MLATLLERNAPPQKPGEEVKLLYASQIGTAPPTFAIVSNRPDDVPESYQRYLVQRLSRGLAVHRVAAPAQVHQPGLAAVMRRRCPGCVASYLVGAIPTSYLAGAAVPRHRPAGARQRESRRHQPLPGAGVAVRDSGRPVRHRQGGGAGAGLRAAGLRARSSSRWPAGVAAIVGPRVLGVRRLQGREGCGDRGGRDAGAHAAGARRRGCWSGRAGADADRLRLARRASRRPRSFPLAVYLLERPDQPEILWLDVAGRRGDHLAPPRQHPAAAQRHREPVRPPGGAARAP